MNVDRIIAEQRAALLATTTGTRIAVQRPAGGTHTRAEHDQHPDHAKVRRHGSRNGISPKDES